MSLSTAVRPTHTTPGQSDPAATFEETVRRHYRLVFSIAYGVLGSASDAEDATQEAFLKAYRARAQLEAEGSLEAWLSRIARNAALDVGRRRGRDDTLRRAAATAATAASGGDPQRVGEAQGPPPSAAAEATDERERLRAAIATLSEPEALAVRLRFIEGLTPTQIAARLKEEPGTIRVRLHRALKRLRQALGEEE